MTMNVNRLRFLAHGSFFAALLGFFYVGGVFVNATSSATSLQEFINYSPPAFIFVYLLPVIVTIITAIGAYFLLFRGSDNTLFVRCALLGMAIVQVFALIILIAWLLSTTGLTFILFFALVIALIVGYVKLLSPLSPRYVYLLEFLVVGLFLSSWYSSMVTNYCARQIGATEQQSTETATLAYESCTNSSQLTTVIGSEVKRIFSR